MITVTISGPTAERKPVADLLEKTIQMARYTSLRYTAGNEPPENATQPQVLIQERDG